MSNVIDFAKAKQDILLAREIETDEELWFPLTDDDFEAMDLEEVTDLLDFLTEILIDSDDEVEVELTPRLTVIDNGDSSNGET